MQNLGILRPLTWDLSVAMIKVLVINWGPFTPDNLRAKSRCSLMDDSLPSSVSSCTREIQHYPLWKADMNNLCSLGQSILYFLVLKTAHEQIIVRCQSSIDKIYFTWFIGEGSIILQSRMSRPGFYFRSTWSHNLYLCQALYFILQMIKLKPERY